MIEYEEIRDAIQEGKVENDGIWLSWADLWRIDAIAVRNGNKALKEEPKGINTILFQNFVGQRMLIGDLAELVRPKEQTEE